MRNVIQTAVSFEDNFRNVTLQEYNLSRDVGTRANCNYRVARIVATVASKGILLQRLTDWRMTVRAYPGIVARVSRQREVIIIIIPKSKYVNTFSNRRRER